MLICLFLGDPLKHKVPINDLVKSAIDELTEYTKKYRAEHNCRDLFINVQYGTLPKVHNWTVERMSRFIRKWDIRDSEGNLYPLKSHQFRATFFRELVKKEIPLAYIMKQFAHVSIDMTAYYLTLEDEEIREIYTDMIFGEDSKIAGLWTKEIKESLYCFQSMIDISLRSFLPCTHIQNRHCTNHRRDRKWAPNEKNPRKSYVNLESEAV